MTAMSNGEKQHLAIVTHNKDALNNLQRAVVLGQGQFSLILARANYQQLRRRLIAELASHLRIETITIPADATNLREAIVQRRSRLSAAGGLDREAEEEEGDHTLMVTGLEDLPASTNTDAPSVLEKLLKAANLGRDELPKRFPYPVVLWVNDTVLQQLNRYAPDLKSFAATPIRFEYPIRALTAVLRAQANETFTQILDTDKGIVPRFRLPLSASITAPLLSRELAFAIKQLEDLPDEQSERVSIDLLADLLFLQGRNLHQQGDLIRARNYYEDSLMHWQNASGDKKKKKRRTRFRKDRKQVKNKDKQAILQFHLGLWWRAQAATLVEPDTIASIPGSPGSPEFITTCLKARQYFENCLTIFREQERPDRLARFILALLEVLKTLKDWPTLNEIAQESIRLHQQDLARLARDYGYLAEVALARYYHNPNPRLLTQAQSFAQQALDTSEQAITTRPGQANEDEAASKIALRYHRGNYFYLLAIALQKQAQPREARLKLERALQNTDPHYDLPLYRQILERLWQLYFNHQKYAEAFELKLEQRRVETLFGLRAFIGAGQILPPEQTDYASFVSIQSAQTAQLVTEIKASGRSQDIEALIGRLSQPRYPVVVMHGQSGVGKSSILRAGLVPRLRALTSEGRRTLPVCLDSYSSWIEQLAQKLNQLGADPWATEDESETPVSSIDSLIELLVKFTQESYQQIVLIFDQFEDFFSEFPNLEQRKALYFFLRDCLDLPYVKVLLSLREDFLHYLLEWDRNADLSIINNDILSKEARYYLGNFSPQATENLIHQLTRSTGFHPDRDLIAALVDDLSEETGEVSPIELQVVGAQLQRQNITTLEQYRDLGRSPKSQLLKNFLDSVIQDCGPENETVAQSVLYLLSEGKNRPLKSIVELQEPLELASIKSTPLQLSLVLDIFIGSGLVFEVPEVSGMRYQLVHDYLAGLVQDQQQPSLIDALQDERRRRQLTEEQLKKALDAQSDSLAEATLAKQKIKIAEIRALISVAKSLQLSGSGIEALAKALRAATQVQDCEDNLLKMQTALCLRSLIAGMRERNELSGHRNWVLAVAYSPKGDRIASASEDDTIKVWDHTGKLLHTLTGHHAAVLDVCFSADGNYIISASLDHTIRLWQTTGEFVRTIEIAAASVTSVSYSPTNELIAATYSDTTVRLWNLAGELIQTLDGHDDWVRTVTFSPNGILLATGSEDRTVRIWKVNGELLHTFDGHRGWVRSVDFSPDGRKVISAGDSNVLRLWSVAGYQLETFYGHEDWVRCVAFSPNGEKIASAGDDQTIRIWAVDGTLLQTFYHRSSVHSVAWSADGRSLVSGGDDDHVHIWRIKGPHVPVCWGHEGIVWSARWQPHISRLTTEIRKSKILSAGGDNTIKLWSEEGDLLKSIPAHERGVHSADWSPDGLFFVSASADYTLKIWQADGTLVNTLRGHGDAVWQVKYSPLGDHIASVSSDHTLRLWTAQGKLLRTWSDHTNTVCHVSFSPDGQYLISASEDKTLRLWHHKKGLVQTLDVYQSAQNNRDQSNREQNNRDQNNRLESASKASAIENALEGSSNGLWCVAFSPDGRLVASGGADGFIRLWRVTWQKPQPMQLATKPVVLKGHRDWVRSLCFSPNGHFLASASDDETVRLWAIDGSKASAIASPIGNPLEGHEGVVWDVSFDPMGKQLVSASADGSIRIWDLDLDSLSQQGCQWLSDWMDSRPDMRKHLCERREPRRDSRREL